MSDRNMQLEGTCFCFGDNINTDEIIPARYLTTSNADELAAHCMEDADKDFVTKMNAGDVIVGGANFGCGSSREHAPISIKAVGVSCVIAVSFARIFFRNCINIGMPILECPEAAEKIKSGDRVRINLIEGTVENITQNQRYAAEPFPAFMQRIIEEGGLMAYARAQH